MGFFSWKTSDTNKSISNVYSSRGALPVYLVTPFGDYIKEDEYGGYGVFGGYDVYALVAKWNCPQKCNGDIDHDRLIGIDIACYDNAKLKYPIKFAESRIPYDDLAPAEDCEYQGYFYDDDSWEDDEEEDY